MENNDEVYRLGNFIVKVDDSSITASNFVYFNREHILREFSHPATIEPDTDTLVIHINNIRGRDVSLTENDFTSIYESLLPWNKTTFFRIFDNNTNETFFCRSMINIQYSRVPRGVVKK